MQPVRGGAYLGHGAYGYTFYNAEDDVVTKVTFADGAQREFDNGNAFKSVDLEERYGCYALGPPEPLTVEFLKAEPKLYKAKTIGKVGAQFMDIGAFLKTLPTDDDAAANAALAASGLALLRFPAANTSLGNWARTRSRKISNAEVAGFVAAMGELFDGVGAFHEVNLYHMDLHADNIVLFTDADDVPQAAAMIDFEQAAIGIDGDRHKKRRLNREGLTGADVLAFDDTALLAREVHALCFDFEFDHNPTVEGRRMLDVLGKACDALLGGTKTLEEAARVIATRGTERGGGGA